MQEISKNLRNTTTNGVNNNNKSYIFQVEHQTSKKSSDGTTVFSLYDDTWQHLGDKVVKNYIINLLDSMDDKVNIKLA